MGKMRTAELVAHMDGVPSLPEAVSEIVALVNDPDSSAAQVCTVIQKDIGLTAKLLQVANSAYYAFPNRIGSVQLAVSLLGMNEVRNIVLSATVVGMFKSIKGAPFLSFRELWVHSVNCAVAARTIASQVHDLQPEEAFVGGLLHDVGMVVLLDKLQNDLKKMVQLAKKENVPFVEAERRYWDHTHARIGGVLARRWKLPKEVAQAAEQHHFLSPDTTSFPLTAVVHLADSLCIEKGNAYRLERTAEEENPQSWDVLDEKQEDLRAWLRDLVQKDEEKAQILLNTL
jgi:putative nucleotidyltransferase with HDIG domain